MTWNASASFGFLSSTSESIRILLDICGVQVICLYHGIGVADLHTGVGILCLHTDIKMLLLQYQ